MGIVIKKGNFLAASVVSMTPLNLSASTPVSASPRTYAVLETVPPQVAGTSVMNYPPNQFVPAFPPCKYGHLSHYLLSSDLHFSNDFSHLDYNPWHSPLGSLSLSYFDNYFRGTFREELLRTGKWSFVSVVSSLTIHDWRCFVDVSSLDQLHF